MDQVARNLSLHENCSRSYSYVAATDYSTASVKIPAKVGFTIHIIKIAVMITTAHAATATFQDSASTPIIAAGIVTNAAVGPLNFDFGPDGFALTADKSFDHKMSAAGGAGSVTVTAYYKKTPNVT